MRKRTILAFALASIALVVMWRRRQSPSYSTDREAVSPINEPVPGDEPIDSRDRPDEEADSSPDQEE